jgi:hypothetical protein
MIEKLLMLTSLPAFAHDIEYSAVYEASDDAEIALCNFPKSKS